MSGDSLIRRANLKALGYTPTDLAKLVGKSSQYFRDLMEVPGKSFGEKTARNIEEKVGLLRGVLDLPEALTTLQKWRSEKKDTGEAMLAQVKPKLVKRDLNGLVIPEFSNMEITGKCPLLREQAGVIRSLTVSREWLSKNIKSHTGDENLCIVTGFGDSMKGMFNSGDPLIVDRGVTAVEFDSIYFFRVGDEGFIKRLQRVPGEGLRALSENKKYETWTIKADMDFEVFGRVLKAWHGEEF
jgi:hypothetical protein